MPVLRRVLAAVPGGTSSLLSLNGYLAAMNNRLLLPLATLVLAQPLASRAQQTPARTATPLAVGSVAPAFKGLDAAGRPVEL